MVTGLDDRHSFTVTEFAELVREVFTVTFPTDVWIEGEVRNIKRPASGHVYFDLVDAADGSGRTVDALLSVVLFSGTKATVNAQIKRSGGGMRIADGVNVRIRAVPDFYPPQGRFQLRMSGIDPSYTIGQLAAAREELLRRLAAEELLDANAAQGLALLPLRVGLVTAAGSAASADFLQELASAGVGWQVQLAATPVQGEFAHRSIAASIVTLARSGVDVVAVVRGGGARTDLVAFDHEVVARAIATCTVPVLTGIGHEVDTTVADEVAHSAFKTPTACAAHLVDQARLASERARSAWAGIATAAIGQLAQHESRVITAARTASRAAGSALRLADIRRAEAARRARQLAERQLDHHDHRLTRSAAAVGLEARHRLASATVSTDHAADRLGRRATQRLTDAERRLERLDDQRRLLDPARALARGWSITSQNGAVVRSAADLEVGALLTTRFADGTVTSTVRDVDDTPASE